MHLSLTCKHIQRQIKSTRWISDKPKQSNKRFLSTLQDVKLKLLPQKMHSHTLTWHDQQASRNITTIHLDFGYQLLNGPCWIWLLKTPSWIWLEINNINTNCEIHLGSRQLLRQIVQFVSLLPHYFYSGGSFKTIYMLYTEFFSRNSWHLIILIPRDIEWKEKF